MYPIPAPMFALSPKFAHNSWHSQYKSNVTKIFPQSALCPLLFFPPPQTLALPKMFQVRVYKCLGHVMRDSWYGKWCAPLVLLTSSEVVGVENDKIEKCGTNVGSQGRLGADGGKDLQQYKSTDWLTDRPAHPHSQLWANIMLEVFKCTSTTHHFC